ncbi:MAG: hypothetical protein LUQ71_10240 [Methanoregula sp.]|nr:hypothetical protein [Methanoregula sp.]
MTTLTDIKFIESVSDANDDSQGCILIPPHGLAVRFNAVISSQLSQDYTIPTKKVDQEYADHIFAENRQFDLSVKVKKSGDLQTLKSIADAMVLYAFACDFGYFENVAVKNFTPKTSTDSRYNATVSLKLVQLVVGTTQKTTTSLPVSDASASGSTTAKTPTNATSTDQSADDWIDTKLKEVTGAEVVLNHVIGGII